MRLFALAAAIAAVVVFGSGSAHAQNVTCTGTMGGGTSTQINGVWTGTATQINGNVTVPKNASCTLAFVNVSGNVQVQNGGSLVIDGYGEPSTIVGNVQATNCVSTLIKGNVTVKGNVEIQNCSGSVASGFQGPGIVIGGNFQCHNNAGPCEAWLGQIAGNADVHNNGGTASDVSLNAIEGNLQCQQNAAAPTHSHGVNWVTGHTQGQCGTDFSTTTTSLGVPASGGIACSSLMALPASQFPVPNMVVTSAVDTPATSTLPHRCVVNLSYNPTYVSPVSGCKYNDDMQVQLPVTDWNGRFFYAPANGGTVGTASDASGALAVGFATATDNSGISSTDMAACGNGDKNQYFADPYGAITDALQTQQISSLVGKYVVAEYYGQNATTSYAGGCSGPGRQSMMMSEVFPQYFDGIYAGAPGINFERTHLSQVWSTEQVLNAYLTDVSAAGPATIPNPDATETPEKLLYQAFPTSDRTLVEKAMLQACDALDGVADGVIDNAPACQVAFNPSTASYVDSSNVSHPLQCTGAKDATCLTPAQINVVKGWQQGARNSGGGMITVPSGATPSHPASRTVLGFSYDAGWGGTTGLFREFVGNSATSPPTVYAPDWGFFVYGSLGPPIPSFDPTTFNFDTQLGLLAPTMVWSEYAGSVDLSKFANLGHKIIYYHGTSDGQHPVNHTISYYTGMADLLGGIDQIQSFSRMYVIPNMAHCGNGPSTDKFDVLAPLQQWVEQGTAPGPLPASGTNFTSAQFAGLTTFGNNSQPIGGTGGAPTTRSRPLCPYPQEVHFTSPTTIVNGAPVATNPADLAVAANYTCVAPSP